MNGVSILSVVDLLLSELTETNALYVTLANSLEDGTARAHVLPVFRLLT
jgi:hypothetical protein